MDARWTDRDHVARATRHFSTLQFQCQPPCQPSVSSPFKRALFLPEQTPEQTLSVLEAGAPNAGSRASCSVSWSPTAVLFCAASTSWLLAVAAAFSSSKGQSVTFSTSDSSPQCNIINRAEVTMSRYTMTMIGGIAMTAISGILMIWWLALNTGSGFVGFLFIMGMLVGLAVFAGSAAEAVRSPDQQRR